jgi:hypothetical protein
MASFVYTAWKRRILDPLEGSGGISSADVRVLLVMSNTTADTDQDLENIGDIGTLDEMDGANYVRKALASEVVNQDDANNRAEFDATDVTWTALGAGTRSGVGMVLYCHVTNDADAELIAYIDTGGFPFAPGGGDVTVAWNAEGIIQAS